MKVNLEELLKTGQVKRYHTEAPLRPQDVAQHVYNVVWLCWWLTDGAPSAQLLMAALSHDSGERWTGDMPAPVKRKLGVGYTMEVMEAQALADIGVELNLRLSPEEDKVLRVADALEGVFYCYREVQCGNLDMKACLDRYVAYTMDLVGPEHKAFDEVITLIQGARE